VFILPHEAKALLELFCLQPIVFGWRQNSSRNSFGSWHKKYTKTPFYIGGSGLDLTDDFQKFCWSRLDSVWKISQSAHLWKVFHNRVQGRIKPARLQGGRRFR